MVGGNAGCSRAEAVPAASAGTAAGARVRHDKRGTAGESALRVHIADDSTLAGAMAGGRRSPVDPTVPGTPTAPDSGASDRPHPACAPRLQLRLHADTALALARAPAPCLADHDPARGPGARPPAGEACAQAATASAEALRAGAARGLRPYARCSMVERPA